MSRDSHHVTHFSVNTSDPEWESTVRLYSNHRMALRNEICNM